MEKTDGSVLIGWKHTFLSGGADVLAAGEMKLRDGNLVGLNNLSGYYITNAEATSNYLMIFKSLGVDVSKTKLTIYNSNGWILK